MEGQEIINLARDVIKTEIDGLFRLGETIDGTFVKSVKRILSCTGKIIVSGMGKSGHVGKKISSTLCSTGTPSYFIHPSECSHGDLGAISRNDIVIIISNSGETKELSDLILHTKKYGIFTIGIASVKASKLLISSDIALLTPKLTEACTLGLAPTTSTTALMALGDALSIAVMQLRKFNIEGFKILQDAGIEVCEDIGTEQAKKLLDAWLSTFDPSE